MTCIKEDFRTFALPPNEVFLSYRVCVVHASFEFMIPLLQSPKCGDSSCTPQFQAFMFSDSPLLRFSCF